MVPAGEGVWDGVSSLLTPWGTAHPAAHLFLLTLSSLTTPHLMLSVHD